ARFTKNVTMLYDGDAAGIKASLRGTDMLLKEGLNVKVLLFSDGHDPDSYIQKSGPNSFQEYISKNQQDFISFKTQILLQDAAGDPVKRAGVIRDIVESIALIPDQIKASVFIRDCSVKLNIEERILISELNKIRIQQSKKATSQRDHTPEGPPEDLFSDDQAADPITQETKLSANDLQEQEIIRLLLQYGEMPADWLEQKEYPIALFILSSLKDIEFTNPPAKKIADIYTDYLNRQELPEHRVFITNPDKEISTLTISLLSSRHSLSPNWNDDKRQIYVKSETDNLKDTIIKSIYRMKKRKIEERIQMIREEMNGESNEDNTNILLDKYKKLKEIEKETLTFLGTVITR